MMDATFQSVHRLWDQGESIKGISRRLNISHDKVRRILITLGLYTTEAIAEVQRLKEAGSSIDEIAEILGYSRNSVIAKLPYEKGMYNAEYPTINALRIRKCRKNKDVIREYK